MPDDLILEIMNYFRTEGCYQRYFFQDNQPERASLLALSYTCKRFNRLARPLVFRSVYFDMSPWEQDFIGNFFKEYPQLAEYIRYYRGSSQDFLETVLSKPLDLYHLTIPPATEFDKLYPRYGWIGSLHRDLIVREMRLMIHSHVDPEIFVNMHRFKGLKTLCIEFADDPTHQTADMVNLSTFQISCPELEHLAVLSVCKICSFSAVHGLPNLQSLYIELRHDRPPSSLLFGDIFDDFFGVPPDQWREKNLWLDTVKPLKDSGVSFFVGTEHQTHLSPNFIVSSWYWSFYLKTLEFTNKNLNPPDSTPITEWFIRSIFFFADYFKRFSDPETPIDFDFRSFWKGIYPLDNLLEIIRTIKSLESIHKPKGTIWIRMRLSSCQPLLQLIDSMPSKVRILEIELSGEQSIPPSLITELVSASSELYKLSINIEGPSSEHSPSIRDNYPRFTRSLFAGLFPFSKRFGGPRGLTLSRGCQPHASDPITSSRLEENSEFVEEMMGLFDLNPKLSEIELKFWRD
jgi:hypothetical protein